MSIIRVLHIGLSSNMGGIESVVKTWTELLPDNIVFDFVNLDNDPLPFEEIIKKTGGKIYNVTPRKENFKKSNNQLKNIMKNGKYDFIHHHIMSFSWPEPCLIANSISPKPYVILHAHTVLDRNLKPKVKLLNYIGKFRLKNNKYIGMACSKEAGYSMFKNNNFKIIANGIDFSLFEFDGNFRNEIRKKFGLHDDHILIGHVGRSAYEKNYKFLLESFKSLYKNNNKYRLMLIGDILNDNFIQNMIDELNIRNVVFCTGAIKDVKPYYCAMDYFYLPSIIEGVSVSLLEAQATGLTCIVSKNVSKESKISDYYYEVDIDCSKKVVKLFNEKGYNDNQNRKDIKLKEKYNSKNSSIELFKFYYSLLSKVEINENKNIKR